MIYFAGNCWTDWFSENKDKMQLSNDDCLQVQNNWHLSQNHDQVFLKKIKKQFAQEIFIEVSQAKLTQNFVLPLPHTNRKY